MRSIPLFAAASLAALAVPALGQSSVEIHTGANGQLSGSATAGGSTSSTVTTGNDAQTRVWDERPPAGCTGGDRSRSMRVTSPDGSSSSSVSVSGGNVAVGGSGSPGSRISEGGCADRVATMPEAVDRPAAVQPTPRVVTTSRVVTRPASVRHRGYAHTTRRRVTRRR